MASRLPFRSIKRQDRSAAELGLDLRQRAADETQPFQPPSRLRLAVEPCNLGERRYGIPKTDPYAFYLAYHEGHKGYVRGTYRNNRELQQIADAVARRTRTYARQLGDCEPTLNARRKGGSWLFG